LKVGKILLVEPGHRTSTIESFRGLADGFSQNGVEVWEYGLNDRLDFFTKAMKYTGKSTDITLVSEAATESIIVAAIQEKVDVILYITAQYVPPLIFNIIRERLKIPQGIILTESPYMAAWEIKRLKVCNFAFTNEEACVEPYRKVNKKVFYVPVGYRQEIFERGDTIGNLAYDSDIFFVGTIFPERVVFLNKVCESLVHQGLNIAIFGSNLKPEWTLPSFEYYWKDRVLEQEEYAKYLSRTKIALNLSREHRTERNLHIVPISPNPRFFEIMSLGKFCLTEWREGLRKYGPGENFETFRTAKECVEKIKFYLEHEGIREQIAQRGKRRVFRKENWQRRAEQMIEIMKRF